MSTCGRKDSRQNEEMRATGLQPMLYIPAQAWSLFFKVKISALQSNRSHNARAHKAGLPSLLGTLRAARFSEKMRPDLPPGLLPAPLPGSMLSPAHPVPDHRMSRQSDFQLKQEVAVAHMTSTPISEAVTQSPFGSGVSSLLASYRRRKWTWLWGSWWPTTVSRRLSQEDVS